MKSISLSLTLSAVVGLATGASQAAVIITQQAAPAPTYAVTLNFDEVGGPTGANVPGNAWAGIGITSLISGEGSNFVGNLNGDFPWLPNNNVYAAPFGAFINYGADLSAFSVQVWDPSGPPGPFGGGLGVAVFDDGVEVGFNFFEPSWGGIGDSWFNITTTGGSKFDEVRILGFGFSPTTYIDNLSWNVVPAPGALAMLGLAGLVTRSRRRSHR